MKQIEIPIEVQDSASTGNILRDHAVIRLQVEDRNDQIPVISVVSQSGKSLIHVSENAAPRTVIAYVFVTDQDSSLGGQVTCATDASNFKLQEIDISQGQSQYQLLTMRSYDREQTAVVSAHLHCSDKGTPAHWSSKQINVTIDDLNDVPPRFLNNNGREPVYSHTMFENNEIWRPIIQMTAKDADSGDNGRITYSVQSEFRNKFRVAPNGTLFSLAPLDREENDIYKFIVYAEDNGNPSLRSNATVKLSILDDNDFTPTFLNVIHLKVYENASLGTRVGSIRAIDKDLDKAGEKGLRYSMLEGQSNSMESRKFRVDKYGRVLVRDKLNREELDIYTIYVIAVDQGAKPLTGTGTVNIHVLDINDNVPQWVYPQQPRQQLVISYALFTRGQSLSQKQLLATDADMHVNAQIIYSATGGSAFGICGREFQYGRVNCSKGSHSATRRRVWVECGGSRWRQSSPGQQNCAGDSHQRQFAL